MAIIKDGDVVRGSWPPPTKSLFRPSTLAEQVKHAQAEHDHKILWQNIHTAAATNPGLKDLLSQVEVFYRLSQEEK